MKLTHHLIAFMLSFPLLGDQIYQSNLKTDKKKQETATTILIGPPDHNCFKRDTTIEPGIHVKGMNVPGGITKFYHAIQPYYENQTITQPMLDELKRAIVRYYQDNDRPVVQVKILPQKIRHGILKICVTEATIDQITFKGNKWFGDQQLRNYIDFDQGDLIRRDVLTKDLEIMNRNPFRRTDVVFSPGSKSGTTNLEFITKD